VVDASLTWGRLIAAIQTAGGLPPVSRDRPGDDQIAALQAAPALASSHRPRAELTTAQAPATANAVSGSGAATQLLYSPGASTH
jgi:hypothetical protein